MVLLLFLPSSSSFESSPSFESSRHVTCHGVIGSSERMASMERRDGSGNNTAYICGGLSFVLNHGASAIINLQHYFYFILTGLHRVRVIIDDVPVAWVQHVPHRLASLIAPSTIFFRSSITFCSFCFFSSNANIAIAAFSSAVYT